MQKYFLVGFLIFTLCLLPLTLAGADSLWKKESTSPYSPHKAFRVGDIITIIILETTSALQKAGTGTSVNDDLAIGFSHNIQKLYPIIAPSATVAGSASNIYAGTGQTSRSSKVQAKVAAVVKKILPNGNLIVSGSHKVEVNEEAQQILITGVVRSKDISLANTVYSYQIADAEVSIKGTGMVAEAQAPGWITRILNWLF